MARALAGAGLMDAVRARCIGGPCAGQWIEVRSPDHRSVVHVIPPPPPLDYPNINDAALIQPLNVETYICLAFHMDSGAKIQWVLRHHSLAEKDFLDGLIEGYAP